ncbi:DUF1127 domain-containing protein [Rhizobium sp. GCM10022189]|uniref:DUF1127 domain-containing protein n=1 Tax=Rhizobium sp. GCM10022189 TaxID=3252654 RepID=UPI003606770E
MKQDFVKRISEKHEFRDIANAPQLPIRVLETGSNRNIKPEALHEYAESIFSLLSLLKQWRLRMKERRELARIYTTMPDEALADLGLTREEAEAESGKPFWRC